MDPVTVLTALAELAPTGGQSRSLDATGGRTPLWLDDPDRPPRRKSTERLAAADALHRDERVLRRGWVFVVGTGEFDGKRRQVCMPLLSEPVRLRAGLRGYSVARAGDLQVTELVADEALAAQLESAEGAGTAEWLYAPERLQEWLDAALAAAGLSVVGVRRPPERPPKRAEEGLFAVVRAGLFVGREVFRGSVQQSLYGWANRPGIADTALAAVYGNDSPACRGRADSGGPLGDELLSPLPLSAAQEEVVRRSRTEPVTVVSGPPGSGKSHAVAAAALDTVDRGGSVLLATQSPHAADVLGELLDRYPGPTPILFGDAEHRDAIATELAGGVGVGYEAGTLRSDVRAVAAAVARVRQLVASLSAALRLERTGAELPRWQPLLPALSADAPGGFARDFDDVATERLAARLSDPAGRPVGGMWARVRRWWTRRRLRRALRAHRTVPDTTLQTAARAARSVAVAARLASCGGTNLAGSWRALQQSEADLAEVVGVAMRHRAGSAERWGRAERRSAAALAGALRAGRNRRRQLLAGMNGKALVRGLPLWVGTAADTGDLLPPEPGLFDLVILDEASHLDQLRAAPVLARARRALIVGDPRQLRFVSFVADVDVADTLHRHGLDERVDVRRISAFDLATAVAPVTWLDEHYRSAPHLIEFSATRFYGGRLSVATRHPRNDAHDLIDVVRVPDGAVHGGVNRPEVEAAVRVVRELVAAGTVGIAVVTPFRAQADALEAALVEEFPVAELERLALRVGTVHAFQGSEADTVVVSLGLTEGDSPARTRFVADPHLFNVMVTRARRRTVVVTSIVSGPGGADDLIGDYLAYAGAGPPGPPLATGQSGENPVDGTGEPAREPMYDPAGEFGRASTEGSVDEWTQALAAELRRSGTVVRAEYPVGRWKVDLCVGTGERAFGLICRVHPDGPAAHLDRQRALARAGWRLVDAFGSRWSGDAARAAVELTSEVRGQRFPG